ncbi:MAG: alpha/beta fold hydrolase [Phycisphaerales bacterium]|nr:alpha/beta fold hydrolase [Phycisphaerales bacterium]
MRRHRLLIMTVLLAAGSGSILAAVHAASPDDVPTVAVDPPAPPADGPRTVVVPLKDGVLEVDRLLQRVLAAAGVGGSAATGWKVDLNDPNTMERLAALRETTGGVLGIERRNEEVLVTFDPRPAAAALQSLEGRLREGIRSAMGPRLASASTPVYGIRFYTPQVPRLAVDQLPAVPRRAVVLVHGFDDPGWTWGDMLPRLNGRGYAVARFEYPNDGPIPASADLLGAELLALRAAGVERVDLVTHSMGGLLARDLLTRPQWYGGDARGGPRLPAIERLVMLGPPNHGSKMARLAPLSELKDQVVRWLVSDDGFGARPDDGNGEAAAQLLPGSSFLQELNRRPMPSHVRITIVAARFAPSSETVSKWIDRAKQALAGQSSDRAAKLERAAEQLRGRAESTMDALGDGLVPIASVRLEGVDDFVIVNGDHLGMVARWKADSPEPPAIPIVLDRLAQPVSAPPKGVR